ncbi:hypothetical protein SELMODRAFT_441953 [Selaginella moellendorffii]|uniref:Mediator complex subunit Med12 domain-containing protein n=1 Tax=Selaginella moellendorffii TaxID=88036 RepID=D8RP28_SELML|nr:hypothetical protein SELMODRAFT_441953 [Selaginella moellendorffii]
MQHAGDLKERCTGILLPLVAVALQLVERVLDPIPLTLVSVSQQQQGTRTPQLTPYRLKCEKEPLNPRLGPPDFYFPAPDCPEESLTRDTCTNGYKEAIEGIEEARETTWTLATNNALWAKENISRYKESLRKRLRAVTNALVRKRKAGQVYDVPLVGALLAKAGQFPERHTYGEDYRKKWIEDLSQRKRLSLLAEHVPHGFHRRTLFEALVKQNVPFLRATWFIKISYLNQVRPASSAGADKSHGKRLEQWTRDVLDYAQSVLDEICSNASRAALAQAYDSVQSVETDLDGHAKWHYIVRLVQWQYAEGLLQQSHVVEWALKQIQEKESLDGLELLLPVLLEFMDSLSLSQVHVRMLVDICQHWLRQLGVSNVLPSPEEQPQQYRIVVTFVEIMRYLLVAVPDTFVAFDCFPLLPCVTTLEGMEIVKDGDPKADTTKGNGRPGNLCPYREVYIMEVVDSIQKRASSLTKAVNPGVLRNNDGKVIQALDKSLAAGDLLSAFQAVFDSDFSGYDQLPGEWKTSSSNLPFLSGMLNNVNLSDLFAVRYLCEWAVCDFRDTRQASSIKVSTGIKDLSRIYTAASVLLLKKDFPPGSHAKKARVKGASDSKLKRSPMHEIIVAWIDQHDSRKGESMEKMQLLLYELVRRGIFHPDAYVRQLIVEGLLERRESPSDISRAARHRRVLRYLPGLPTLDLDDTKDTDDIPENARLYRNERRLALHGFHSDDKIAKDRRLKDRTYSSEVKVPMSGSFVTNTLDRKQVSRKPMKLLEVKQAVCAYLQIPDTLAGQQKFCAGPVGILKRVAGSSIGDTHGCEECNGSKRLKTGESKGTGFIADPEDSWWIKKVPKVSDPVKLEASIKPPKQGVRGRPKTVRKTQSLAQLHSARVDGGQGASSSHSFDSKVHCPYHRPAASTKLSLNDLRPKNDFRSIGSALKQLTVSEKFNFSSWLDRTIRSLLGEGTANKTGPTARCQLSDEQFGAVVYMLDMVFDYNVLVRLLLWLLPMAAGTSGMSARAPVNNKETCGIGEAAILSCLRRYELVITSLNLLPEVLTVGIQCASSVIGTIPSGRSQILIYVSELLNKYKGLMTVQSWQKTWRGSCDQKVAMELEALKVGDSESALGFINTVGEDRDDPIPQRLNSRLARVGASMKDSVQKALGEAVSQIVSKERELQTANFAIKDAVAEKVEEYSHRVVTGLLEAIKQNGTAQTDSGLVNAAVSALVSSASSSAANAHEVLTANNAGPDISLRCARRILQLHVRCLRLLKDGLDDRQSRVLDVSLASEASTIVAGHFVHIPGRAPRSQFHLSPETPELGTLGNDFAAGQNVITSGRAASATALVVMAVVHGVLSLERLVTVLKIRDGLEALHLPKLFGSSNGLSRGVAMGSTLKSDEVHIHWFRILIGDCKAIAGGLVADILGDATLVALARTQRLLPLNLVFPMAYAMFCGLLRRQVLSRMSNASRDDSILQSLSVAVADIVKHEPFREVCLQDTRALYVLLSSDGGSSDYAALLDEQGFDARLKVEAMLPFSGRLFLHSILDGVLPSSMQWQDDEAWVKVRHVHDPKHAQQQMVLILDELQPATFHWQWLELRLHLNELVFVEKIEAHNSAVKAMQASVGASDQLYECEKVFTENVLTNVLFRPDAGALYSEVLHSLGKPLEEYIIKLVKWSLQGVDVLYGKKSLRQRLEQTKGYIRPTSALKSWGWQPPWSVVEAASPEEGEVSQDNASAAGGSSRDDALSLHFAIEKALADLVLPCLARSLNDTCSGFAFDLVSQMAELEQQVTLLTRSSAKFSVAPSTADGPAAKNQRRGARSGLETASPSVRRRPPEASAVSAAALQSSMWLRLQFLLPLLRIIYCDRENMRLTLAPVLLRLLGTRVVYESAESFGIHQPESSMLNKGQWNAELASMAAAASAGEELFDRLLSVLHALLSNTWAVWLKPRGRAAKPPREVPPFEREAAEKLQTELDHMQLPMSLRMRLQAAMPVFPPGPTFSLSAAPPQVPQSAFTALQANLSPSLHLSHSQKLGADLKSKPSPSLDTETGMDPWLLLEDGTGLPATVGSANSSTTADGSTLKACPWLKGAVRVRRTELTHLGSVDSDT